MDKSNYRNVLILIILCRWIHAAKDGGQPSFTGTVPCNDKSGTDNCISDNDSGPSLTTEPIPTTGYPSSVLGSSFPQLTSISPSPSVSPSSMMSFKPPLLTSSSPLLLTPVSPSSMLSFNPPLLTSSSPPLLTPVAPASSKSTIPPLLTSSIPPSSTSDRSSPSTSVSPSQFTTGHTTAIQDDNYYYQYQDTGMINSTDVNMYLEQPDAQDYIASFSQEFQRMLVEATLRYCPYVSLCNFTFGLDPPWSFLDERTPCCLPCFCQTYCVSEGNCCPDYRGLSLTPAVISAGNESCMPTFLRHRSLNQSISDTIIKAYQNCPQHTDEILRFRCAKKFDLLQNVTLDDVIPLSSNATMKTYRNRYCALCNGVDVADLTPWTVRLTCVGLPSLNKAEELLSGILDGTMQCQLEFQRPSSVDVDYCSNVINSCNVTGLWVAFDPVVYRACSVYETMIVVERDFVDAMLFKNPFCAICNGMEPSSEYMCKPWSGDPYTDPFTFSGLLRLDSHSKPETTQDVTCGPGLLFDEIKNRCHNVTCPYHSIYQYGLCEPYVESSRLIAYRLSALLRSKTDISTKVLYDIMAAVRSKFGDMINSFCSEGICTSQTMIVLNDGSNKDDMNATVDFIEFTYDVQQAYCDLSIDETVELLLGLDGRNITIDDSSGDAILFNVYLKDDTRAYNIRIPYDKFNNWTMEGSLVPLQDLFFLSFTERDRLVIPYFHWGEHPASCPLEDTIVRLLMMRPCPMVTVDLTEFGIIETPSGLKFKARKDTLVGMSDYVLGDNYPFVRMCLETYKRVFQTAVTSVKKDDMINSAESVVSLVSVSTSIVCLVISLFTYCFLPQLQTLPGKNNMALIVSLLLAQGMYLAGSYGRLESTSFACKLVSGLTHFFWLLSIFWMNVCTFHMFRVLKRTKVVIDIAPSKKYLQYHSYCILLSTAFVSVNVIVTMVTSDFSDYGYGATRCYISTQRMIEVTFGIPAAIVVIANLAMFIMIIVNLTRTPTVTKNAKHDRNYFIVFVKMSTITGATWLFGFVYMWTGITAFSFVFIILNASQGLFLMLSFVCNVKTLAMLKDKWKTRVTSFLQSLSPEARLTNVQGSGL